MTWWPINRSTMFRQVTRNGVPAERVIYAVSPDGKVFTATVWQPNNPNPKGGSNLMHFHRQSGLAGSN